MVCPTHGEVAPAFILTPHRDKGPDFIPAILYCGTNIACCPNNKNHKLERGPRVDPQDVFALMGELNFMKFCSECGVNVMPSYIMCVLTDGIEHLFDQRRDPYRYR